MMNIFYDFPRALLVITLNNFFDSDKGVLQSFEIVIRVSRTILNFLQPKNYCEIIFGTFLTEGYSCHFDKIE